LTAAELTPMERESVACVSPFSFRKSFTFCIICIPLCDFMDLEVHSRAGSRFVHTTKIFKGESHLNKKEDVDLLGYELFLLNSGLLYNAVQTQFKRHLNAL